MLDYPLRRDEGILAPGSERRRAAVDFTTTGRTVDAHPERQGTPRGILIHEEVLRSWNDFGALLAQLQIIKQQHRQIEKVAIVADGGFATIIPFIASHFIHAQVKHFDHAQGEDAARDWLLDDSGARTRTTAYRKRQLIRKHDLADTRVYQLEKE